MTCVTVYYCVTICVFDFLHTLAFLSASDIDKYIWTFLGMGSHFLIKALIFSCSNILFFQNLNFESNY